MRETPIVVDVLRVVRVGDFDGVGWSHVICGDADYKDGDGDGEHRSDKEVSHFLIPLLEFGFDFEFAIFTNDFVVTGLAEASKVGLEGFAVEISELPASFHDFASEVCLGGVRVVADTDEFFRHAMLAFDFDLGLNNCLRGVVVHPFYEFCDHFRSPFCL